MTVQKNILGGSVLPLTDSVEDPPLESGGFDLSGFVQMVRMRKEVILATAVAAIVVTGIYVFHMTPLYDASALVMLDQRENKVVDVNAVLSGLPTDATSIENQLQILRSRNLMSHVVDKLHLDQTSQAKAASFDIVADVVYYLNPLHWFASDIVTKSKADLDQERRNDLIDGLLGAETVTEIGGSSAMKVIFRSANPETAAATANAIADAYVDDQLNAKFEATQKTSQWLADRLQQLQNQMQAADAAVQEYKAENNITETATGGSILDQQLAQLNGQLVAARAQLAEAQAKYAKVRALQANGQAEEVAQVFQSGMIEQLRQQQADLLRQKAQLATTFGPRHPKMLDIESQIRNVDAKITEEVKRVVETVGNDVSVANAQVQSLQSSLTQLEGQSAVQNKAKIKLSELQARSSSVHQLYDAFLGKFKEMQGQESIQTPDARIISRAVVPDSPAVPNKIRDLELAAVFGLLAGLAIAYLLERLDAGVRTTDQIETMLGVPVLSTLPELQGVENAGEQAADRVIDKPLSSFAEAVRGLQMGLVLSNVDQQPKVMLITSSVPDEGKTTVALALARTIARADKKVVLIDGDLRHPSLVKAVQLSNGREGLIEVL
ncbi:MAG: exopolysaccharide transport family protein, partial [Alphaproteobacteria bacterium]|nr:exopolysaccharide transport family protein [Alphaproteobacteria bacterium]